MHLLNLTVIFILSMHTTTKSVAYVKMALLPGWKFGVDADSLCIAI